MSKTAQRRKANKTNRLGAMLNANYTGRMQAMPIPDNRETRRMKKKFST